MRNTYTKTDLNTNPTGVIHYKYDVIYLCFVSVYSFIGISHSKLTPTRSFVLPLVGLSSCDVQSLKSVTNPHGCPKCRRPFPSSKFSVQRRDGACPNRQIFAWMFLWWCICTIDLGDTPNGRKEVPSSFISKRSSIYFMMILKLLVFATLYSSLWSNT